MSLNDQQNETVQIGNGLPWSRRVRQRRSIWLVAVSVVTGLLACAAWWSHSNSPSVAIPTVDLHGVNSAVKRMIESARNDVATDPHSGAAWGRLGMILSAHEFSGAATECFRQAASRDHSYIRWPYLLAVALETSDPDASAAAYRTAIECAPRAVLPQIHLAELFLQQGDFAAAGTLLRNLVSVVPNDARVHYRLAQLLFHQGQWEASFDSLTTARALAPRKRMIAELLSQLNHVRRQQGMSSNSCPEIDLADATETGWPDAILEEVQALRRDAYWNALHAQQLMESGQFEAAIGELELATAAAPDDWTLRSQLARACIQFKRLAQADQILNDSINRFPQAADLFRLRGTVRLMRNEWPQAAQDYRQAIALKADDAASYADLGFCLQQLGEMTDARQAFTEALRLDPNLEGATIQFARLLIELKDFAAARKIVESLLKTHPNHATARLIWEQATEGQ